MRSSKLLSASPTILPLFLDVIVPIVTYYGSRGFGASPWLSVLLGSIAPCISLVITKARNRHLDSIALFVIIALILSLGIALITGNPRVLLARESWITAALGLWMLVSSIVSRPFMLEVAIKTSTPELARTMERLWSSNKLFHQWMRRANVLWGLAFLLDAGTRVVMAFTLPIDSVPLLSILLLIVLLAIAQGYALVTGYKSGVLALLRDRDQL